jgi:hypothetical protein
MGLILREEVRMQEPATTQLAAGFMDLFNCLEYTRRFIQVAGIFEHSFQKMHQSLQKRGLSDRPQDGEGMLPCCVWLDIEKLYKMTLPLY